MPLNSNLETKTWDRNVNKLKVSFLLSQCPIISIKNLNDVECANQIDEELNNLIHRADSKSSFSKKRTKWRIKSLKSFVGENGIKFSHTMTGI